eukprot:CAMPEP_0185741026 /NCGR_PEP_ID=MMETSP1171-20130828/38738_1 /TAXON_ID=374046 /ORGANISM="Helicotheca tamensis, Strain CCMP826" /LENGTH=514 /DNA_ID=CAMNT_0028412963 /DNA_START=158 /DNA_END=1703 /DNA_ORIENTATION=+
MKNATQGSEVITTTSTTPSPPPATTSTSLLPEYEKAEANVLSSLPTAFSNDPTLITPVSHFVQKYFHACNEAKVQNSPWSISPRMVSYHALMAMKLGIKASGQLRRQKKENVDDDDEEEEGAFEFGVAHKSLRGIHPTEENGNTFDYYKFGCNFFKPALDAKRSVILGQEHIQLISQQVQKGDNIIFFANHQTEPDPQVISLLLENIGYGDLAEDIMYVAGHKVTTDPIAIPFSMGQNLLCIHSKKHKSSEEDEATCADAKRSVTLGQEHIQQISQQVQKGDNIIFFANHQTEPDPQVISILLENIGYGDLAEDIMYVAGHKVTTDPIAIPFSMGQNLLCIHSKKHKSSEEDEAKQRQKQKQNLLAMGTMSRMLKKGGALLWVAPSGGRDRRDLSSSSGEIPIAPFDSKTIDMFRLMGEKSKVKTHYYPMAMRTYEILSPPDQIVSNVGETRDVQFGAVGIAFAEELDNALPRHLFAQEAEDSCRREYEHLVHTLEQQKQNGEEERGNAGALHP